jgi:hypothetical protein
MEIIRMQAQGRKRACTKVRAGVSSLGAGPGKRGADSSVLHPPSSGPSLPLSVPAPAPAAPTLEQVDPLLHPRPQRRGGQLGQDGAQGADVGRNERRQQRDGVCGAGGKRAHAGEECGHRVVGGWACVLGGGEGAGAMVRSSKRAVPRAYQAARPLCTGLQLPTPRLRPATRGRGCKDVRGAPMHSQSKGPGLQSKGPDSKSKGRGSPVAGRLL